VQASIWTLLCGHLVICTPYAIRSVTAGLVGMDPQLEEAAMSPGATRVQAFFKVTLPLLRSSLLSGAIFAFIISFSDINLALFLSGPQSTNLPVHIFSTWRERLKLRLPGGYQREQHRLWQLINKTDRWRLVPGPQREAMEREYESYLGCIKDSELKKKLTPDYNLRNKVARGDSPRRSSFNA
jgi:Binding-protein-dependent transport system inner membrane component